MEDWIQEALAAKQQIPDWKAARETSAVNTLFKNSIPNSSLKDCSKDSTYFLRNSSPFF